MSAPSESSTSSPAEAPCPRNLVLVGFMGCGKSTVGRELARTCRLQFVDLDDLIIEKADGKSIPDIFAAEGEDGFRQRETVALKSLLGREGMIVATGGGVVTIDENLPLLRQLGYVVWLDASMEDMWQRVSSNRNRPMLHVDDPQAEAGRLWHERCPRYRQVAHLAVETAGLTPDEVACGVSSSAALHFTRQNSAPVCQQPG